MAGDPKECRKHAARCRQLAANAPNELVAENFFNLALTWEQLAAKHESAQAFLAAIQAIEPREPFDPSLWSIGNLSRSLRDLP
jgi:hypothetical protein